jgi:hypothetical protein
LPSRVFERISEQAKQCKMTEYEHLILEYCGRRKKVSVACLPFKEWSSSQLSPKAEHGLERTAIEKDRAKYISTGVSMASP